MNVSKKELGEQLQAELKRGYSINRISNWAYDLSIKFHFDSELDETPINLILMLEPTHGSSMTHNLLIV